MKMTQNKVKIRISPYLNRIDNIHVKEKRNITIYDSRLYEEMHTDSLVLSTISFKSEYSKATKTSKCQSVLLTNV